MAVAPGKYDISLQRRADYSVLLQFQDSLSSPIDLTGYTVYAQVWNEVRSKKYADFAVTYTNRTNGEIKISLTDEQTITFPDELRYDVLLEDSGGIREYYLEGTVSVSQGYTVP